MTDETEESAISKEEYDSWVPAEDVLGLFSNRSIAASKRAIAERLSRGDLRSAAKAVHPTVRKEPSRFYRELPNTAWLYWHYEMDDHFWEAGDTVIPVEVADGRIVSHGRQLFQARFDPEGLREMGASLPLAATSSETGTNSRPARRAGGRPPKPWPEVMARIAGLIHLGDLKPANQADVERAMIEWFEARGKTVGESTVREPASLIWKEMCASE